MKAANAIAVTATPTATEREQYATMRCPHPLHLT
jgi:hypothetical protein